jgi:hypothetical protein
MMRLIDCEPVKDGDVTTHCRAWCQYCQAYHHHVWEEPDANGIIGHRIAHCRVKSSPYLNGGYVLRLADVHREDHPVTKAGTPLRR